MEHHRVLWQTEMLRLTFFPSHHNAGVTSASWENVVGELPETQVLQPRTGGTREEGPYRDGKLIFARELQRIDWLFALPNNPNRQIEGILTLGPFREVLDSFCPLIQRWFALSDRLLARRLAFGAVLLQPVRDYDAGYRQLSAYLPLREIEADSGTGISDFLYQINRPRLSSSGIPGIRINRLSKWSVGALAQVALSLGPAEAQFSTQETRLAVRLELDINTVPTFQGELSQEQFSQLFQELIALAEEIACQGEVP